MKLLYADDDKFTWKVVKPKFEQLVRNTEILFPGLEPIPKIEILPPAFNEAEVRKYFERPDKPDFIFLDKVFDSNQKAGLSLAKRINEKSPETKVIIQTGFKEMGDFHELFSSGTISAYLEKREFLSMIEIEEIVLHILSEEGGYWKNIPNEWFLKLGRYQTEQGKLNVDEGKRMELGLTPTEWKIFKSTAKGFSKEEIIEIHEFAENAYYAHMHNIRQSLNLPNRNKVCFLIKALQLQLDEVRDTICAETKTKIFFK